MLLQRLMCTALIGAVQIGFAFVSHHEVNKCPNSYGVPVLALDPTGQPVSPSMPVIGSLLVQLGLAMGVYDADQIQKLQYNQRLCPKEHAQDWCGPRSVLLSGITTLVNLTCVPIHCQRDIPPDPLPNPDIEHLYDIGISVQHI